MSCVSNILVTAFFCCHFTSLGPQGMIKKQQGCCFDVGFVCVCVPCRCQKTLLSSWPATKLSSSKSRLPYLAMQTMRIYWNWRRTYRWELEGRWNFRVFYKCFIFLKYVSCNKIRHLVGWLLSFHIAWYSHGRLSLEKSKIWPIFSLFFWMSKTDVLIYTANSFTMNFCQRGERYASAVFTMCWFLFFFSLKHFSKSLFFVAFTNAETWWFGFTWCSYWVLK